MSRARGFDETGARRAAVPARRRGSRTSGEPQMRAVTAVVTGLQDMLATDLTTRQRDILDFIREWVESHGYPPSVREIGEAVGLVSPS
ncbi:MAG TPA: repressor LexA, partial [Micromonosporaceae bacterium]|nr:repressor LexA [Micromonosporaceae bacterium]